MKKCSMNEDDLLFDIPEMGCHWKFHRLPNCFTEVGKPWLFVHGPLTDYVARWTKQDESCSFLSNFRDLLLTGYSSTTYIFQSTIQPSPLLFSTKKPDRFQLSPFLPPPQKKQQPPFPISAAWCPLTPFRSQVSTGLDLVELSETGEWLTTEVLGKGRDPTSIQDRFEAVWCGRWFYEKRATMVGCLGFFFGGGDEKTSQFCGDYCIVNQWFNHDTDPYSTARMTHGK